MKFGTILHNTGAGDEAHEGEDLMELLHQNGFEGRYLSVDERGWKDFEFHTDFLIVAGGDGTVRKVVKALLDRKMIAKTWPIALLPLGTANNIAKTLQLPRNTAEAISGWQHSKTKRFDVGCLYYKKKAGFFLESFGYGLFPYLMMEMKKRFDDDDFDAPNEKIKAALKLLHQLIPGYKAKKCRLRIDEVDYSGKFLMLEVMNSRSMGPNLQLAPHADPGDGLLDVVMVPEEDKDRLMQHVLNRANGVEDDFSFNSVRGKNIVISWEGSHVHVDDETLKIKEEQEVRIETKKELLEFIVP